MSLYLCFMIVWLLAYQAGSSDALAAAQTKIVSWRLSVDVRESVDESFRRGAVLYIVVSLVMAAVYVLLNGWRW